MLSFSGCPCSSHSEENKALLPPHCTVRPAMDDRRSPPLPESAPTQPSIPPAASRQNSLVIPSLAPDKTPARLRHNLRPPDRLACNTNIFHKGGRRWRQMFHILDEALDVLPPCPPSLCSRWPDIWAHSLVCECVFFFLILEPPPHPCGRCIAQASL